MPGLDIDKDYYAILDTNSDATVEQIRKAYHKLGRFISIGFMFQRLTIGLALRCHPDRNHGKEREAAIKFQDVSNPYEILTEPSTKLRYDGERARILRQSNSTSFTSLNGYYNPHASFPLAKPTNPAANPWTPPENTEGSHDAQYTAHVNNPWTSGGVQRRSRGESPDAWTMELDES